MSEQQEQSTQVKKKKKWLIPVIIGSVSVVILAIVAVIVIISVINVTAPKRKLQKQLDLGEKYISELDYEKAILAYQKAIEIDPNCEVAYVSLGQIYALLAEREMDNDNRDGAEGYIEAGLAIIERGRALFASQSLDELQEKLLLLSTNQEQNAQGLLYREYSYSNGVVTSYSEYEYDEFGNNIRIYYYDEYGQITSYIEYSYNAMNQETGYVWYDEYGTPGDREVCEYDAQGRLIKQTYYDNGEESFYDIYVYDEKGDKIKETRYVDGGEYFHMDFVYDNNHHVIQEESSSGSTNGHYSFNISKYYYDANGRMIRNEDYMGEGSLAGYSEYEYSDDRTEADRITFYLADGTEYGRQEHAFDENNRKIKRTYIGSDGSEYISTYEYLE